MAKHKSQTVQLAALGLLLLLDLCHASKVSLAPRRRTNCFDASVSVRGGSTQRRWERMDGKVYGGLSSSNGGELGNSFQKSLQSVPGSGGVGRACNCYIWDAPSALLHKWCHHLLRDCVYEGLGGRKFVRIEPGSILQLLYPCSRYSPDRCVVCGGTFRDHLTLWWANNLYTPFDRYLDRTFAAGVKLEPTFPVASATTKAPRRPRRPIYPRNRRYKSKRPKSKKQTTVEMTKLFAFHRQYVLDVDTLFGDKTTKKERSKKFRKELTKVQSKAGSPLEMRVLTDRKMSYIVPAVEYPASKKNKNGQQVPSATLQIARAIVLNAVDHLILMQETENDRIRDKKRNQGCCPGT